MILCFGTFLVWCCSEVTLSMNITTKSEQRVPEKNVKIVTSFVKRGFPEDIRYIWVWKISTQNLKIKEHEFNGR